MKNFALLLIVLTTLFSCSKEDGMTPGNNPIIGKYLVLEADHSSTKYVEVTSDVIYFMGEIDLYGTRTQGEWPYTALENGNIQVYSSEYTISFDGSKLIIDSGTGSYHSLIREATVPNAADWVQKVTPTKILDTEDFSNGRLNDLTYYGGYVYTDGHRDLSDNYVITKINIGSKTTEDIAIPFDQTTNLGYANNIEYVGSSELWTYDWGNPNDHMYEYNINNLNDNSANLMPYQFGSIYHIGSDENEIWGSFYEDIRKWDFVASKWGNKIELGSQLLDGLDVYDGHLYLAGQGMIHKYSLQPFKAVAAYQLAGDVNYAMYGFTCTYGSQLIATAYNYGTTKDEILSIELP